MEENLKDFSLLEGSEREREHVLQSALFSMVLGNTTARRITRTVQWKRMWLTQKVSLD
jgi:hypothetical protein